MGAMITGNEFFLDAPEKLAGRDEKAVQSSRFLGGPSGNDIPH
jgi:hypothetical protein